MVAGLLAGNPRFWATLANTRMLAYSRAMACFTCSGTSCPLARRPLGMTALTTCSNSARVMTLLHAGPLVAGGFFDPAAQKFVNVITGAVSGTVEALGCAAGGFAGAGAGCAVGACCPADLPS